MSSLITVSDDRLFALRNAHFSYVFTVTPEGLLQHLYYGDPVSDPEGLPTHHRRVSRGATSHFEGVENLNLNDLPQEYPTFGRSDYRYPAFHGVNPDGNTVFSYLFKSYKIMNGKPELDGLPSTRGGDCETLIVTLRDGLYGVEVDLLYTVYKDHGVLARSVNIRNEGPDSIDLQHVASCALDLPADTYDILHLHGTWTREFNAERITLPQGRFTIDAARGTSSAAHNPFIAVMETDANEDRGRVYSASLVYSGNFAISTESGEFGDVRILAGLNPFNFGWRLGPGESFQTPEALQVYTSNGLRSMSRIWHGFIRDKISPQNFHRVPRPTYLNTWEAAYFDIDEDKVLAMADKAKDVGVEMLVLDDGWFEGRRDDTSSLGDWQADTDRFPSGLADLAAHVKAKGLKFGLWVEPEMVSPNSQLYKTHPDWALHVPGRTPSLGRHQLTLDLSRPEVTDYLYETLDDILSCGDIDYIKWDMNRNMTEVGSAGFAPERQSEIGHRYMLGLYGLLGRLTQKYPDVLFETCASGGNRFDLGLLRYMAQGWVSDMCDPLGRLGIINGASYIYPLDVMATYIGPSPNHQTGRVSSVKTRFLAGVFCAARGISLNERDLETHKDDLQTYMDFAKKTAPYMVGGRFNRLRHTDTGTCWQYICPDDTHVYLVWFRKISAPNLPFRHIRLVDLDANATYQCASTGASYKGDILMQSGLPLPYMTPEDIGKETGPSGLTSHLFEFRKVS